MDYQDILNKVLNNKNIFITGGAGVGKSYTIKKLYKDLSESMKVYITATTGIASINIGGSTLHSFAMLGLGNKRKEELLMKLYNTKGAVKKWRDIDCLIIDEISMIDLKYFLKLNYIAKKIRNSKEIFGGIKLILCGDFYQLPPIKSYSGKKYLFETNLWNKLEFTNIVLTKVYRQDDDKLIEVLNKIRLGICDNDVKKLLMDRTERKLKKRPTVLYSKNKLVEEKNKKHYNKLKGKEYNYYSIKVYDYKSNLQKKLIKDLEKNLRVKEKTSLKIGTEVLLVANLPKLGLANGSRGKVVGFSSEKFPIVEFTDITTEIEYYKWNLEFEKIKVSISQIPLVHAWSINIHNSQGLTIEYLKVSLGNEIFSPSMAYVALSRAKTLDGLSIKIFTPKSIYVDDKVKKFYHQLSL